MKARAGPYESYDKLFYYPTALRRVQISRGICTPKDRLDRFSRNAQATNWIEVTKKKFVSQNEFLSYLFS